MKECLCLSLFLHLHFSNFLSFCFELVLLFVPSIVCTTISSSRLIIINLDGSSAVVYCCTSINVLCMFFHSGTSVSMLFMATQWCTDKLLLFCFVVLCFCQTTELWRWICLNNCLSDFSPPPPAAAPNLFVFISALLLQAPLIGISCGRSAVPSLPSSNLLSRGWFTSLFCCDQMSSSSKTRNIGFEHQIVVD